MAITNGTNNAIEELKAQFAEMKPKLKKGWMKQYLDRFCMEQMPSENIDTYFYLQNINRSGIKSSAPSPSVIENLRVFMIEEI